jgi:hypothetical protein
MSNNFDNMNINMQTPPKDWENARRLLLEKCQYSFRTRMFVQWSAEGSSILQSSQPWVTNTLVFNIRAVGPRAHIVEGGINALLEALTFRGIKPTMVQRCHQDLDWPNHWLLHIPLSDALNLPGPEDVGKGLLWNTKG